MYIYNSLLIIYVGSAITRTYKSDEKNNFETSGEANVNISSARTMIAETVEKYKAQEYNV